MPNALSITLDSSVIDDERILTLCKANDWDLARVSITDRETENTGFHVLLEPLNKISAIFICGESKLGDDILGSKHQADVFDTILDIISTKAFPKDHSNLSKGEKMQRRNAMILQAHIRERRDVFITIDKKAFIKGELRAKLEDKFNVKIMTVCEFLCEYGTNNQAT